MARKRVIDTEALYYDAEIIRMLGERGLHLYIGLWGIAEDWGGYEPKYDNIAFRMGALFFKPEEAQKYIDILVGAGKIIPYQMNETTYHWIKNLLKHQGLNKPTPPKLPLPKWIKCNLKEYPSGKKYAEYILDYKKMPNSMDNSPENLGQSENSPRTVREQSYTVAEQSETVPDAPYRTVPYGNHTETVTKSSDKKTAFFSSKTLKKLICEKFDCSDPSVALDVQINYFWLKSQHAENPIGYAIRSINGEFEDQRPPLKFFSKEDKQRLEEILAKDLKDQEVSKTMDWLWDQSKNSPDPGNYAQGILQIAINKQKNLQ